MNSALASHTTRGWTMLEMLLCCALIAVLATLSLPNFGHWHERYRVQQMTETFARQLALARFEAVNRGMTMTLCPSSNGLDCSSDWSKGSLLFSDPNANRTRDEGEQMLSVLNLGTDGSKVAFRAFGVQSSLQFDPEGATHQSGHFLFCPRSGDAKLARQLVISHSGRVRQAQDKDGDGIREDTQGQPLDCS